MSTLATGFGWWIHVDDIATMAHYRSLSHDALLKELASNNDASLMAGIAGAVFVVAGITIVVDVLTHFYSAIWAKIGTPPSKAPSAGDSIYRGTLTWLEPA